MTKFARPWILIFAEFFWEISYGLILRFDFLNLFLKNSILPQLPMYCFGGALTNKPIIVKS
jgi:hypothetical protein